MPESEAETIGVLGAIAERDTPWRATHPTQAAPTRILVVDDHGIVREGLAALLDREPDMKVVGFAATGEEAVLEARRLQPAVIIMDLVLPAINGIVATERILGELPLTRVIALSAFHAPQHVHRALGSGARGYVVKAAAGAELLVAVRAVLCGDRYVSPAITACFAGRVPATSIPNSPFDRLSTREREILRRIVAGSSSADIAQQLFLSRKTVDTYRHRLMVKLGVSNRTALIRVALEYELPLV